MTEKKDWLNVPAPDQWMTGWDNYHKKLLELPEDQLTFLGFIAHPVQVVGSHVRAKENEINVLELGCGDGRYACFLAKLGCNVYAIDAGVNADVPGPGRPLGQQPDPVRPCPQRYRK